VEEVAKYINAEFPEAEYVVEVGVGERDEVARTLVESGYDVTVTDVRGVGAPEGVSFVRDDLTKTDASVYEGADLIYSVRPPYELHSALEELAREVCASLVVAPLGDESASLDGELVNYEGRTLFVRRG